MPRALTIFFTALLLVLPVTKGNGEASVPFATWTFGLSLTTGMNNELFTLFLVKEFEGRTIGNEPITRGQFVLQAQGAIPSKANVERIDLFRRYGVTGCLPPYEPEEGHPVVTDCWVFDELWKLRFWEYPFRLGEGQYPGKGWAENRNAPSARQYLLLADYGILHLHSMARGEDMFRLLRDVSDSAWVDNYRKGY